MKQLFVILSLLLAMPMAKAQRVYMPLDEEPTTWVDGAAGSADNVFAVSPSVGIGFRRVDFDVRFWNGLFWTDLPRLRTENAFYDQDHKTSYLVYNNQFYMGGSFHSLDGTMKGLVRWNGSSWEQVAGGIQSNRLIIDEFSVNAMVEYDGKMFIGGDFDLVGGSPFSNLVSLSGNTWSHFPGTYGPVQELQVAGNNLYALGDFISIGSAGISTLVTYDGNDWSAVDHSIGEPLKLASVNGNLVVIATDGFYELDNGSFKKWSHNLNIQQVESVVEVNNSLYVTGRFMTGAVTHRMISVNATKLEVLVNDEDINYSGSSNLKLATLGNEIYVFGHFSKFLKHQVKNAIRFTPGKSVLSGKVYIDNNNNCQFDNQDDLKLNALVSLNDGSYYTSTNSEGMYYLYIDNNATSKIEIFPGDIEEPNCNGAIRTVVTSANDSNLTENFALQIPPGEAKIRLSLSSSTGFKVKHGYETGYIIDCGSVDAEQFPIHVSLKLDKSLTDVVSSRQPEKHNGNVLEWTIYYDETIEIQARNNQNISEMGDLVNTTVTADGNNGTRNVALHQIVVSAYDPNDKQCDKDRLSIEENDISYVVRFQNLGSDNARNIHIVDTIDNKLPLEYLQVQKNSHFEKYATSYRIRGRSVIWDFKGIELPPASTAGDEASSGYVAYKCGIRGPLSLGDEISNTAYIYFDFQPPVITNTTKSVVVNKVVGGSGNVTTVYPSPAFNSVTITSGGQAIQDCYIVDVRGARVLSPEATLQDATALDVDVSDLSTGIYYVVIHLPTSVETIPIVVGNK